LYDGPFAHGRGDVVDDIPSIKSMTDTVIPSETKEIS
jgi:hypothetical protein